MYTLAQFSTQVDYLVAADGDEMALPARQEMIYAALERYSRDVPLYVTDDVAGNGTSYLAIPTLLTGWVERFSRIVQIEYPAADLSASAQPQLLEPDAWRDSYWRTVATVRTRYLALSGYAPASTETMRITYAVPYRFANTGAGVASVDVPSQDFHAITYLAASLECEALAARYGRISDSTINADSVSHQGKGDQFARRAKEFKALYEEHLGLSAEADAPKARAAGAFVQIPQATAWPGRSTLFHRNRRGW